MEEEVGFGEIATSSFALDKGVNWFDDNSRLMKSFSI